MRNATKHRSPIGGLLPPPMDGVNLSRPPYMLKETELAGALNWWLSPYGEVECRPGTIRITKDSLPSAISGLYYSQALKVQLVTSGQKLYVLKNEIYTPIGMLSANAAPQMIDFNGAVYIASGGILQVYDGETLKNSTNVSTNPIPDKTIALAVFDARLFVACQGSLLCWSGANDGGDWGGDSEHSGGCVYIGEKNGGDISGISLCQGHLYAYKTSSNSETYRISGNAGLYEIQKISEGSGASVNSTICPFLSDVLFFGAGGVQRIQMIEQYGDARAFPLSLRIDPLLRTLKTPHSAVYAPSQGYYLIGSESYILAWHSGQESWWPWLFEAFEPSYLGIDNKSNVLIGATNGHIYRLDYPEQEDSLFTDDGDPILKQLSTHAIDFGSPDRDKIWKWLSLTFLPQASGNVSIDLRTDYGYDWKKSVSIATRSNNNRIVGWDNLFRWDSNDIGWDQGKIFRRRIRLSFRSSSLQVAIFTTAHLRWMALNIEAAILGRLGSSWR